MRELVVLSTIAESANASPIAQLSSIQTQSRAGWRQSVFYNVLQFPTRPFKHKKHLRISSRISKRADPTWRLHTLSYWQVHSLPFLAGELLKGLCWDYDGLGLRSPVTLKHEQTVP